VEAIEFSYIQIRDGDITHFAQALTQSLRNHINIFKETSKLKELVLRDDWGLGRLDLHRDFFKVIRLLPSLESLTIKIIDNDLLQTLTKRLGKWKIRRVELLCGFRVDPAKDDFSPVFDAIAFSGHIKVFYFGCIRRDYFLPQSISQQLFDLAMSPNSSLVDIGIEASRVDPRQLSCLVPEEVDPTVAAGRKLRRFDFQKNMLGILEPGNQDMSVCYENLDALLRLLSRQLPYLHSIGVSMRSWTYYKRLCCPRNSTKESELWHQLLVQMERNRVGMALFEPTTVSTVPAGLWSIVLHRALTYEEDSKSVLRGMESTIWCENSSREVILAGTSTARSEGDKK
jgi:hypothetical protein